MLLNTWLGQTEGRVFLKELPERYYLGGQPLGNVIRNSDTAYPADETLGVLIQNSLLGESELIVHDSHVHVAVILRPEGGL